MGTGVAMCCGFHHVGVSVSVYGCGCGRVWVWVQPEPLWVLACVCVCGYGFYRLFLHVKDFYIWNASEMSEMEKYSGMHSTLVCMTDVKYKNKKKIALFPL